MGESSGGEEEDDMEVYSVSQPDQSTNINSLKLKLAKRRQNIDSLSGGKNNKAGTSSIDPKEKEIKIISNIVVNPGKSSSNTYTEEKSADLNMDYIEKNLESNSTKGIKRSLEKEGDTDEHLTKQDLKKVNRNEFCRLSNRYNGNDSGPYVVFIEGNRDNASAGKIHPMKLGRFFFQNKDYPEFYRDIYSVTRGGRNRIKIILKSFVTANRLVSSSILDHLALFAYTGWPREPAQAYSSFVYEPTVLKFGTCI